MESISDIPNIAMLAYRYGTIKKNEFELVNELYSEKSNKSSFNDILIKQGLVTKHQIGLLEIIRDFYIIQQKGIAFGKIAVEQDLATKQDIEKALAVQENLFKKAKVKKLIGDILVESKVITLKQRDQILEQQKINNERSSLLVKSEEDSNLSEDQQNRVEQDLKEKNKNSSLSRVSFSISDDCMEALVLIEKGKKSDQDITFQEIKTKLKQEKIKNGIFSDSIIQCYIDKRYAFFPVARGTFPVEHDAQTINYFFKTNNVEKEQIKKGNPLAEQKISGEGLVGKDIFFNPIKRDKIKYMPASLIRCGSGTRLSKDNKQAFAQKTGLPSLSVINKLYIHPVLNILEDADLRYGKIEEYADIKISGILTDAYPVTAGNLKAIEIRGTKLEAYGNINVDLGITGAKIRCQGNIHAKYIKNSVIETFGDVVVQHEIIDSKIIISGEFKGQKARAIASHISAKNSITIGSTGSRVTEPCTLSAGRDDHILLEAEKIDTEIEKVKEELNELRGQKEQCIKKAGQLFKKMIQLKRFHDNTEKKKKKIEEQFADKNNNKKTKVLLEKLNNKMKISIGSLKALNNEKKKIELKLKQIENRVEKIKPEIEKSIVELERDRTMLLNWASDKPGKPEINIKMKASETTVFKGVFSEKILQKDFRKIIVKESRASGKEDNYSLKIFKG